MRVLAVIAVIIAVGCTPARSPGTSAPIDQPTSTPAPTQAPATASPMAVVGQITESRSQIARNPATAASQGQLAELVAGDRSVAFDLYHYLVETEGGNLFISPYSISTAMSMVLAGARGDTAGELAATLGVGQLGSDWHLARNALELELAALADYDPPGDGDAVPLTLEPTNAIFGQAGYPFKQDFLDILAANYGAGMNAVDFKTQTEAARLAINAWVAERTRDRIEELLPRDSIDTLTRAVLVNAIYFKANWVYQFNPDMTESAPFHLLDGSTVDVPMMHGGGTTYGAGDGWQAAQLAYHGGPSMLVVVPDEGRFAEIEDLLDAEFLAQIESKLGTYDLDLRLPRWETDNRLDLIPPLRSLGVDLLFDPNAADLSGIADVEQLYVSDVIHQANITVDEQGTEAAAATAAVVGTTSAPPPANLTVDQPFIYLIRGGQAGEILFMGRLLQP